MAKDYKPTRPITKSIKKQVNEVFLGLLPKRPTNAFAKKNDYMNLDHMYDELYDIIVEEKQKAREQKKKEYNKRRYEENKKKIARQRSVEQNIILETCLLDAKTKRWYSYQFAMNTKALSQLKIKSGEVLISTYLQCIPTPNGGLMHMNVKNEDVYCTEMKLYFQNLYNELGYENFKQRVDGDYATLVKIFEIYAKEEDDMGDAKTPASNELYRYFGLASLAVPYVKVISIVNHNEDVVPEPFRFTRIRNNREIYIYNRFAKHYINPACDKIENLILDEELLGLKQSCLAVAIIRQYHESYDKYFMARKDPSLNCKRLTMNSLVRDIFGRDWNGEEVDLCCDEARIFFEKYSLGLEVFDARTNKILYRYKPEKLNTNIKPNVMKMLYYDNHAIHIEKLNSFEQICAKDAEEREDDVSLSNKFKVKKETETKKEYHIGNNIHEVFEIIKKNGENSTCINIIVPSQLKEICIELLKKGIHPEIKTKSGTRIQTIKIQLYNKANEPINIYISEAVEIQQFETHEFTDLNKYKEYIEAHTHFECTLLCKQNMSTYSESAKAVFDNYGVDIPSGIIDEYYVDGNKKYMALDNNKFYTTMLYEAPYIPVVTLFDEFIKPKSNHVVNDKNMYVIKMLETHPLFSLKPTVMYGFNLKKLIKLGYKVQIIAYTMLITKSINHVKNEIAGLYSDDNTIDEVLVKGIINKSIGMCGKKYNRKRETIVFKNENDCNRYITEHKKGRKFEFDKDVWIVNSVQQTKLINGFIPINEMILDCARMRLLEQYEMLKADNIQTIAFKTDALFFEVPKQFEKCRVFKHIRPGLGGLKAEYDESKLPQYSMKFRKPKADVPFAIEQEDVKETINKITNYYKPTFNEWDRDEVCKHIQNRTIAMCYAGCGKTDAMLYYLFNHKQYKPEEILVVCPWNAQAKNVIHKVKTDYGYDVKAITYHRLKGENINGDCNVKNAENLQSIKAILFDEVLLYNVDQLMKIYMFMDENPLITFLSTGDPAQLESIGDDTSNEEKKRFIVSNKLFPHVLKLNTNKRVLTQQDRDIIENLQIDLFTNDMPIHKIVTKYFKDNIIPLDKVKEKNITRGVSYYDSSAKTLNNMIHDYYNHNAHYVKKGRKSCKSIKLENDITYFVSNNLICKQNFALKSGKLYPNYMYKIVDVNNKTFTLCDVLDNTNHLVSVKNIMFKFSLPYVNTCHASQGDKISGKFIITDWHKPLVCNNWFYTAITRAVSMNDVHFLEDDLLFENIQTVSKNMITSYKMQDRRANRKFKEEDYATLDDIKHLYFKAKCRCSKCFNYMTFEKNAQHKVSLNRINNSLAHVKDNVEVMCVHCNKSLSNK